MIIDEECSKTNAKTNKVAKTHVSLSQSKGSIQDTQRDTDDVDDVYVQVDEQSGYLSARIRSFLRTTKGTRL